MRRRDDEILRIRTKNHLSIKCKDAKIIIAMRFQSDLFNAEMVCDYQFSERPTFRRNKSKCNQEQTSDVSSQVISSEVTSQVITIHEAVM